MSAAEKQFRNWIQGKEPVGALGAVTVATGFNQAIGLAEDIRAHPEIVAKTKLVSQRQWLAFYKDHMHFARCMMAAQLGVNEVDHKKALELLVRVVGNLGHASPEERAELVEYVSGLSPDSTEFGSIKFLLERLLLKPGSDALRGDEGQATATEEAMFARMDEAGLLRFLLMVWVPCMLLANEHPTRLMRRARLGDAQAISLLLRIDRTAAFDPGIARQVFEDQTKCKNGTTRAVARALSAPPLRIDRRKLKLRSATVAAEVLEVGKKANIKDVITSLDIAAQASSKGTEKRDETFTDDCPGDLARQIRRERKDIQKRGWFRRPDKS